MRVLEHLPEDADRLVPAWLVAGEELARRHQDLIGRFAAAAAPAHSVGNDTENATRHAWVGGDHDLVLLIGAIPLVEAGSGSESKASCHAGAGAPVARSLMVFVAAK